MSTHIRTRYRRFCPTRCQRRQSAQVGASPAEESVIALLSYTRAFTHLLFQVLALLICQKVVVQPRSRPPAELLYKRLRKRPGRMADREARDTSPSSLAVIATHVSVCVPAASSLARTRLGAADSRIAKTNRPAGTFLLGLACILAGDACVRSLNASAVMTPLARLAEASAPNAHRGKMTHAKPSPEQRRPSA